MGYYRSEKEAAYFALRELETHLPETPTDDADEWGTMIFRFEDEENGGYWYSYQKPYASGKTREWEYDGFCPSWAEPRAFCHTHPNISGFSTADINTALGISFFFKSTFYMINKDGAYWYNGTYDLKMYARNSLARYGTYWGVPYITMAKK